MLRNGLSSSKLIGDSAIGEPRAVNIDEQDQRSENSYENNKIQQGHALL